MIEKQILSLQWEQLKHDESYHKDIVILPLATRLKHMALHNAKYVARFLSAVYAKDQETYEKTLVDAFVISMATANILNQNLGLELVKVVGNHLTYLDEAGDSLMKTYSYYGLYDENDPMCFIRGYATQCGNIAKACEAFDHVEDMSFRKELLESNSFLFKIIFVESFVRRMDLPFLWHQRIQEIEAKSIFNESGSGGEA